MQPPRGLPARPAAPAIVYRRLVSDGIPDLDGLRWVDDALVVHLGSPHAPVGV
jgi:hypothetical protein